MSNSATSDILGSQQGVQAAQNNTISAMKALADKASKTTNSGELLKIQTDIDDEKRKFDALKQINETLKGCADSAGKFLQAR